MFAKLTGRRTALVMFSIAALFIIFTYITEFYAPVQIGQTGIYALPALKLIAVIYVVAFVVIAISIIEYGVKSHSFLQTGAMVVVAVLLFVPLVIANSTLPLLREHENTLATDQHVYQVASDMLPFCPDTFDAKTYTCYNRIYVYECDRSGIMCSIKSPADLNVKEGQAIQLRLEDNQIEVLADEDEVVYALPV